MSNITLDLPPEQLLTITTGASSTAVINRKNDSTGGLRGLTPQFAKVNLIENSSVTVGPFSSTRRYSIDRFGDVTYSFAPKTNGLNLVGTGIYSGGIIASNADPTKFDVPTGVGTIVDNYTDPKNPILVEIEWPDMLGLTPEFLLTDLTSYIAIDSGGQVVQFAGTITDDARRDYIILGLLVHTSNVVVEGVELFPNTGYDQAHNIVDLSDAIGIINKSGNLFDHNGANLEIVKSSGILHRLGVNWPNSRKTPNNIDSPSDTAPNMFFSYRDGSGGWVPPPRDTSVDPDYYDDDSGTLAAVQASDPWTVQRIFLAPNTNDVIIAYGQEVYKSLAGAEASIIGQDFETNPVLNDTSLRAFLLLKRGTTDLTDSTKAKFIEVNKFGTGPAGGVNTATTDLQSAYNNSGDGLGEIITNSTNLALTIRRGSDADTDSIYCGRNAAETEVFHVTAEGQIKGAFTGGLTAARPAIPLDYEFFFDTTIGKPIWYNGTNWVDATGTTV